MIDDDANPLGPLADVEAPALGATARDRTEASLRVQHAAQQRGPSRRGLPRWAVVGPVLALVLIVATVALVLRDEEAVAALQLSDAEHVTVTLADGAVVIDPSDGFALTDGAVVVVGPGGRVTIDDVTLGPETTVTVRDGRLVTDVVATTTSDRPIDPAPPTGDDPPAEVRPSITTTTSVPPPDTRPPVDDPVAPTTRPTAPPLTRPPPSDAPPDVPPDSRPDEPAHERDVAVALRVNARDSAVRVVWSTEGISGSGWRVVVLRTTDGTEPTDPVSATVVGEGERGEVVERVDDFPARVDMLRYRVLVLDEAGGVVARSAVQTLPFPGS